MLNCKVQYSDAFGGIFTKLFLVNYVMKARNKYNFAGKTIISLIT